MTDYNTREKADMKAYDLQQSMTEKVLNLVVEKPTLEYSIKKQQLMLLDYKGDPGLKDNSIQTLFEHTGWDTDMSKVTGGITRSNSSFSKKERTGGGSLDLLIWNNTADPLLPFLFGSIDKRTAQISQNLIKYDAKTFSKGHNYMRITLEKIYKVIKFRNPVVMIPKPLIKATDWFDDCQLEPVGTVKYYYKWNNDIHFTLGKDKVPTGFRPSCKYINLVKLDIPAHYYTVRDYEFVFIEGHRTISLVNTPTKLIDVTPLFRGQLLDGNIVWPKNLKRIVFPMHLVEAEAEPLFHWMVDNRYQNNRNLNYYMLKEEHYVEFINGISASAFNSPKNPASGTSVFLGEVYGDRIIGSKDPSLAVGEAQARVEAEKEWEVYEEIV